MKIEKIIEDICENLVEVRDEGYKIIPNPHPLLWKIIRDVNYGKMAEKHVLQAIYYIFYLFENNLDTFKDKEKKEQTEILFSLLRDSDFPVPYDILIEWTKCPSFETYINRAIRNCVYNKQVFRFYELLNTAFFNFVKELGAFVIYNLLKYSEGGKNE